MHDVIRSLKESRRFERMSSTKFSTTSTADLYELVLASDGDEQLARERVFAALPLAITLARHPPLN